MLGVLIGFAIICSVIAVGYVVEKVGVLGPEAQGVLTRTAFFVTTPCLLFSELAHSNIAALLTGYLAVSLIACLSAFGGYVLISRLWFRRPVPETMVGAGASSLVNINNIGLPVAIYVLGGTEYAIPVMLLQVVVLSPTLLTMLDITTSGHTSLRRILSQPLRNPMILGSLSGVILGLTRVPVPEEVLKPFAMIGGATIPLVLISFGMSLVGQRPLQAKEARTEVLVASFLKLVAMPGIAWLLAAYVFHLQGMELYAVVICAALPTAQNIFNFSARYDRGVAVARDTVLVTTVLSIPLLILIAALLAL